jgi:signal transduction histidine kinase
MGKGDLSVRVPEKGSGELRQLAENYNTMAAQLENLDRSRNQFVSNASHELKTPLATMKILLETMMYQPDMPGEVREEFMADMNHEIDRLTGIITDLLTLTRMDNKSDALKMEEIDLSGLTEETVRLLTPAARKRGQRLESSVAPDLRIRGDRTKLNQVLYNLIDNAMKYTQDGGEIHVSLEEKNDPAIWRVRDNGVGIPPEDQEHIFDRFYRVDKARSRETGGTGLGLSIVRQLVGMHQGQVYVESEPGKGSCFVVELPRNGKGAGAV